MRRAATDPLGPAMRDEILRRATERFGRDGYENTKWADIASDLGVGPTALYHYFESKQHCLFVILESALGEFRERFLAVTGGPGEYPVVLRAVLADVFDLDAHTVLRNRLLVAELGLLGTPRRSPREEAARQTARERIDDIEVAWATFLARGMEQGVVAEANPRLLARALLGLYNSVWPWYRQGGALSLDDLRDFFVARGLAMAGVIADVGHPGALPEVAV